MTHEEKVNYMRIASNMCRFGFSEEHVDLLVTLYELVLEKEGQTDLKSITQAESAAKERANVKSRSELLDKVSRKVKK